MTGRPLKRNFRLTQIAFGVIIAFLVAQVAWWLWFQADYIDGVSAATEGAWRDDAELANRLSSADPDAIADLLGTHPHLELVNDRFVVDPDALNAFVTEQGRALRMFRFEGIFFVLVVLAGLWILGRSLAVARELERRQHNFLLAVTHEFRTPISTLRLLIETLQYRAPTRSKVDDYLNRMERELLRLERSSDQVLASARLEQLTGLDDLEKIDLNAALQAIVEKHRSGLETRGAQLEVVYAKSPLPTLLQMDALELVVTNLLENAVKYSPEPEKPIRVMVYQRGEEAVIDFEDDGVGIDAGERERVFERFYRPGSEMTRRSQGVGLGLYLVKTNVEMMRGSVRCGPRDGKGRGTRFTVILPLASEDAPASGRLPMGRALGRSA